MCVHTRPWLLVGHMFPNPPCGDYVFFCSHPNNIRYDCCLMSHLFIHLFKCCKTFNFFLWGLSCEDVTKCLMLVRTSGNTLLVGTGQYTAFVGTSLFAGTSADTLLIGTGQYIHSFCREFTICGDICQYLIYGKMPIQTFSNRFYIRRCSRGCNISQPVG